MKEVDLLKLQLKEGTFWLQACQNPNGKKHQKSELTDIVLDDYENIDYHPWVVVKSFKSDTANRCGYRLTEGEIIKLGRVKFHVREICIDSSMAKQSANTFKEIKNTKVDDDMVSIPDDSNVSKKSVNMSEQTCRICLSDQANSSNPFFSPCNCTGSMKYIHVICLQKWLKNKLQVKKSENATSIYWKILECELCKKEYTSSIQLGNKRYDLIEIEKPQAPFIILDIMHKDKNQVRGVHVIKLQSNQAVRLGRGHDSDIRITDISVSRCHALIKYEKNNFYLEDNQSKFGTLVYVDKPMPIIGDFANISVQVGRSVLSLTVKKNWKVLTACFSSEGVDLESDRIDGRQGDRFVSDAQMMQMQVQEIEQLQQQQLIMLQNNNLYQGGIEFANQPRINDNEQEAYMNADGEEQLAHLDDSYEYHEDEEEEEEGEGEENNQNPSNNAQQQQQQQIQQIPQQVQN